MLLHNAWRGSRDGFCWSVVCMLAGSCFAAVMLLLAFMLCFQIFIGPHCRLPKAGGLWHQAAHVRRYRKLPVHVYTRVCMCGWFCLRVRCMFVTILRCKCVFAQLHTRVWGVVGLCVRTTIVCVCICRLRAHVCVLRHCVPRPIYGRKHLLYLKILLHEHPNPCVCRYVYHALDQLYLLLITNKGSNIMEDLDTLRLLSKGTHVCVYFTRLLRCQSASGCWTVFQ